MRNQIGIILFVFVLVSSVFGGVYSGGAGEPNEPFIIATANDLQQIAYEPNDWDKCFKMVADVNLAELGRNFDVIAEGDSYSRFTGVFDGKGHVISNLKIELDRSMVGLFGYIGDSGAVKNLSLEAVDVNGGDWYVGGITGRNEGVIDNCHVRGVIKGQNICGGITGACYGYSSPAIYKCSFEGQITGISDIGGIVGDNGGDVVKCYAIVEIIAEQNCCGGIVGHNTGGNFQMCFSKGTVTCSGEAGGFAGVTYDHCGYGGDISNCYADVTVNCSKVAGGFAGVDNGMTGQISNCYCSGKVIYDANNYTAVGGFIGSGMEEDNVTGCYFLETIGPDNGYAQPLSQQQTQQKESFAGWDFINAWGIGENQTYPYLRQYSAADISRDGVVNFADFAILADRWLE